jgi:Ca2+/Na+ antiporter
MGVSGTSIVKVIVTTQIILAILIIAVAFVMERDHQRSSPTLAKSSFMILVIAYGLLSAIELRSRIRRH